MKSMTGRRRFPRILFVCAALCVPLMRVTAQDPAATANITGRVTALGGVPVAGLEVRLDGTNLMVRTDTRGSFGFIGAPSGAQDLVVRGIGYLPARKSIRVPEMSTGVEITILPAPTMLDTVAVKEKVNVLSGIVVDENDHPVPGATIELITGDRRKFSSGDDGWFIITSVREGTAVFRTTKEGYYLTNTAVRMHEWRGVVVRLETLDEKMSETKKAEASGASNNSAVAWRDASLRMSMKGSRAVVISEEELAPFTGMSLGEAIKRTKSGGSLTIDLQNASNAICVLLDGRRAVGSTSLDSWRAGEVEMVELYPPGTESSNSVIRYLRGVGCRSVSTSRTRMRSGPFYAVLWMK